jgi:carbonic anhydrase/acetyltransferase-like protein (isoleucine patch superfamily)
MPIDAAARLLTLPDRPGPHVAESAFVAAGAVLVGTVHLAEKSSVWYNAVLRAEAEAIRIGPGSNLQDNVSCHVDAGFPLTYRWATAPCCTDAPWRTARSSAWPRQC